LPKLTNTTPGDYPGPLIPGSPAVFSLKNDAGGFVDFNTLNVRYGQTGIVHSPGILPEDNDTLAVTVSIAAPERVSPVDYIPVRSINGSDIRIEELTQGQLPGSMRYLPQYMTPRRY
jgi:hypothetical protein